MKKVFNTSSEVIHLFAQQEQNEARMRNCFFENRSDKFEFGDVLYSYGYHYELARFISENVIIIDDSGYSVTTSKHINEVRYATRQYTQFFITEIDIEKVYSQYTELKNKLSKARKPELYINQLFSLFDKLNSWIEFMNKNRKLKYLLKLNKSNKKYQEIRRFINSLKENESLYLDKLIQERKKIDSKRKREESRKLKKSMELFMNHEINYCRIGDEDFLRLSSDGQYVETTQGVKVPTKEAAKLYKAIVNGVDIRGYKIDGYMVKGLNGVLTIGCHRINKESMHNIGKQII